ncbi:2OG-Fe(II) oxygenase [Paraburkholderia oxyphila]|uniref:2OG-Fe(II) oxygenase n=1 Tax=Paraburkholderia oxyphila TaxID=614212 RepID=UPI000A0409DF|nr:2OG-Fe(II) oxygenase [Paraburkholderia oxyphila]
MNCEIAICDDIVPRSLAMSIHELLCGPIWKFGHQSNGMNDRFSFWSTRFAGGDGSSRTSCETELRESARNAPIARLWDVISSEILRGHEPLRVYANAHTYGSEGYVHVDNADRDNYFSTIYYAHPVWMPNWAGDLVFFDADKSDSIASVFPKPGRVVTFPGCIPHAARATSRDCSDLRLSVVMKSQVKRG